MKKLYKSGEFFIMDGVTYIVLGYSDYKRKYLVLADTYGNVHTRLVN